MRIMVEGVELELTTTEWEMRYPVHVEPIGLIRLYRSGHRAKLMDEQLGTFDSLDRAAEAVWSRFLEQSAVRHDAASHTHGAYERHVRTQARAGRTTLGFGGGA